MPTLRTDVAQSPKFSIQEFWLPSNIIKTRNPLFDRLLRRMRWPRGLTVEQLDTARNADIRAAKINGLKRYTRRYGLFLPIILGIVGAYLLQASTYNYRYSYSIFFFFPLAFFGSIGFSLLCDLYYAVIAINTMTQQMQQGQWDLLRLTRVSERDILLANYAMIMIRGWRIAVLEMGLRFCLSVTSILWIMFGTGTGSQAALLTWLTLLVLMLGYMLEPLWRMRVVTLLGMTITSRLEGYATAIMTSVAALVGLLILQIIALAASIWIFTPILNWSGSYNEDSYYLYYTLILFVVICVVSLIFLFLKGVQSGLFRMLTHVAFRRLT